MLDPVRFITNLSTGEMGYAIAREARRRGFQTTLISGPTCLIPPRRVTLVPIVTVQDLERALKRHFSKCDVLIMAAAVGDFLPLRKAQKKVRRQRNWKITFRQAPDLVREVARRKVHRIVIGFSLETEDWLARSCRKLAMKHLDGIVANRFGPHHNPFGKTGVEVGLIDRRGVRVIHVASKEAFASRLLNWAIALMKERQI